MSEDPTNGYGNLAQENQELRYRLQEAEELITAIRTGAVDALAVQGADGPQIFTLQSADQGYRTLIEQMNEGALLLSHDATILYCNACLAGWLKRGLEEVIGASFGSFVPASFQAYCAELVAQGWTGKGKGELPLQVADGSLLPSSVSMNLLAFNDTPVLAVIVTDLSAQEKIKAIQALVAEKNALIAHKNEELKRQEAEWLLMEQAAAETRRILEGIPQIAWTADSEGRVTYFNGRWFDYVGQKRELPTMQWLHPQYLHPDDVTPVKACWEHCLQTGNAFEIECRFRDQAGNYRWMLGRALPSRFETGEIVQWVGTCTDIHEQKLAQERIDQAQKLLQENNEQLKRINADLDNFIYTASHDLKAPINNIEGLLHALLSELPADIVSNEEVQPLTDMMQDSVDRFKRTIEHLTEVIKLQKENNQPITPVNLKTIIKEILLDLTPLLRESAVQLDIDVQTCPTVNFSEKNLRSVVYNLLSNAIKYRSSERPPYVRIRCRSVDDYAVLDVQDNGLGLNTVDNSKLFSMFQRFHDHVEGTGIGLYMVKKIMENAGGRIEVTSELGMGSTFTAYFKQ
ncbi:ATP-binding protein [Hymenobacter cavernae]|uniref:histidine kinase n=1 Tax=Hymenobacter cavernae TaxID=2044852 RepID=A0ABQ1UD25_9BACT|nr:ATP-binding protein [Hymenobacter cavernae]GGF15118.1 hypothetical protein GCM10011383_27950 [Hymenobacter cavernae]